MQVASAAPVIGCVWEEMRFPYSVYTDAIRSNIHRQSEQAEGQQHRFSLRINFKSLKLLTMQSQAHKCTEIEKKMLESQIPTIT